jgi:CDP-diacylglycerol--glycerol-3-phosphate 3-phosphatidyltransferase
MMVVRSAARAGALVAIPGTARLARSARAPARTTAVEYRAKIAGERWSTPANAITAVRTVATVGIAAAALAAGSLTLLVTAYLVYWVLDIADGAVARHFDHETRLGAVFDITADRASSVLCVAALVVLRPVLALPLAIYVIEFAVVDTMLSLGFLAFAVKGPNDMHLIDATLWRWNWSPPAKAVNTASIVILCLVGHPALASLCAVGVLALKLWSCHRLRTLMTRAEAGPP